MKLVKRYVGKDVNSFLFLRIKLYFFLYIINERLIIIKKKYFFVLLNYETGITDNIYCSRIALFGDCVLGYIVTALNCKTLL